MTVWAIVPVKPLHKSKMRLSGILGKQERIDLMCDLFRHVIGTIQQVPQIDEVLVVSRDKTIAGIAREMQVRVYAKENPINLNVAITHSADQAWQRGVETIVVLPADLGLLEASDIEMMLNTPDRIAICPDGKFDGTNGLMLRSLPSFRFQYGEESFTRHLQEAAKHGCVAQVVYAESIEFDLDTPADLLQYQKKQKVR